MNTQKTKNFMTTRGKGEHKAFSFGPIFSSIVYGIILVYGLHSLLKQSMFTHMKRKLLWATKRTLQTYPCVTDHWCWDEPRLLSRQIINPGIIVVSRTWVLTKTDGKVLKTWAKKIRGNIYGRNWWTRNSHEVFVWVCF